MAKKNELSKNIRALRGKEEIIHNMNIGNMILNAFKSKPDFIGQIDAATGEQTTFQQMREKSVKLALWLKLTIYKYTIISICTSNQMLAHIPFLAGLYLNAIINPWDESYFEENVRIMYFLVEYEPEIIFIDGSKYEKLIKAINFLNKYEEVINSPTIITFDTVDGNASLESILNMNSDETKIDNFSCEKTKLTDIAAIMFSSNAISYPGKVELRYLAFTFPSNQEVPTMSSGDIGLWYGSLTWAYSMILTVRSIVSYVTVIKASKFHDENMYNTIEKYKVNWVFLESSMCNRLFKTDIRMYNLSSLKQLVFGDSDLQRNIYEKFNEYLTDVSITQVYSISDAFIIAAYQRSNNPDASSGYVAKNVQLMILHMKTKEILGPIKQGEIWYRFICKWCEPKTCNSSYCCNYGATDNDDSEESTDSLSMNSLFSVTSPWHSSGDFGFYRKDGKLFIHDRIKHLIKYKTFYVSSQTIENVLQQHPAVSEVSIQSVPNSSDGQHPRAFVKKKDGIEVTEEELEVFVAENLPDMYRLRGGLYFVKKMQYLPNGKIDRMLSHRFINVINY